MESTDIKLQNFSLDGKWLISPLYGIENLSYDAYQSASSYTSRVTSLVRSILNVVAANASMAGTRAADKLREISLHLKFVSIVSVPFTLVSMCSSAKKIFRNICTRDGEGFSMNSLSFSIMAADIVDTMTTFVNTSLTVANSSPIHAFVVIGSPLGFFICGAGVLTCSYRVAKAARLYFALNPETLLEGNNKKARLEKALGIRADAKKIRRSNEGTVQLSEGEKTRLAERKIAVMKRHIPEEVQKELNAVFEVLDKKTPLTASEKIAMKQKLDKIRASLRKKMFVDTVNLVTFSVALIALSFFYVEGGYALWFAGYLLVTFVSAVRLGMLMYGDYTKAPKQVVDAATTGIDLENIAEVVEAN